MSVVTRSSFALLALLAPGCSPTLLESAPRALFADTSDRDRYDALLVAVGNDLTHADEAQRSADADSRASAGGVGCPTLEVADDLQPRVTYAAGDGCTSEAGATYTGTIEVDPALDDGETGALFDGFSVDDGETTLALDGSWSQTDPADGEYALTAHLRTEVDGRVSQVHGTWEIRDQGDHDRITCAGGFQGAIEGLGGFEVSCAMLDFGDGALPAAGWVELTADDTMRVDLEVDANGCHPVTIDRVVQHPLCPPSGGAR